MARCTTAARYACQLSRPRRACALTRFDARGRQGPGRKPIAARFGEGQLPIKGWEEALEGMQMGQTRIIQVPPSMGYGEKGLPIETKDGSTEYLVPPNERLQFELTLVQVSLPPP